MLYALHDMQSGLATTVSDIASSADAIATGLQKHTGGLKTPEQGAATSILLAASPQLRSRRALLRGLHEAMRGDTSRVGAGFGDPMRLGASDNEGVKLWIGYGAIYVQGGQQS